LKIQQKSKQQTMTDKSIQAGQYVYENLPLALAETIIHSHTVVTQIMNHHTNMKPFKDNLSFFRALQLFRRRQVNPAARRASEKDMLKMYATYCQQFSTTTTPFPGVKLKEMTFLETLFQNKILVYQKDWLNDKMPECLFDNDEANFQTTITLDYTSNHFSLIVNKRVYLKQYPCLYCSQRFDKCKDLWNHKRIAKRGVNCQLK
jgi:hypothetical protein